MTGTTMSRRNVLLAGTCTLAAGGGLLRAATALAKENASITAGQGSGMSNEEIIQNYYAAWAKKEWSPIGNLLADDFTFTSPNNDDHISKSAFKTRCWESQVDYIKHFDLESVIGKDDQAFVKYLCHTKNGKSFRNVEYWKFRDGKVAAIECYFGGDLGFPSAASLGQR